MALSVGTRVLVEDQGEGWFPLATSNSLGGTVVGHLGAAYVIALAEPIELQLPTRVTPSGLRRSLADRLILKSRWRGIDIGSEPDVSCHLAIVELGTCTPSDPTELGTLQWFCWAKCTVDRQGPPNQAGPP